MSQFPLSPPTFSSSSFYFSSDTSSSILFANAKMEFFSNTTHHSPLFGTAATSTFIPKRSRNPIFIHNDENARFHSSLKMPNTPSKRASYPPRNTTFTPYTIARDHPRDNSPNAYDSQSSADELPPTPTKLRSSRGKQNSLRSSLFGRRPSLTPHTFSPRPATDDYAGTQDSSPIQAKRIRRLMPLQDRSANFSKFSKFSNISTPFKPQSPVQNQDQTPNGNTLLDTNMDVDSDLSIFRASTTVIPPSTPTAQRDLLFDYPCANTADDVVSIKSRFHTVSLFAHGEFSLVFRVQRPVNDNFSFRPLTPTPGPAWIVKKIKKPYSGARDKKNKLREVEILKQLKGEAHVLEYIDSWEFENCLYIQTEYCENDTLHSFLSKSAGKARLDDFRVWKILLELCMGVHAIHKSNIIHLDLKPANIFITFEGVLKIGDFGLASHWPAPQDIEGEGDREYISPEVLLGILDKPADVFAIGLITLEIAGNSPLPDNGERWQRLRSGNLSDVPSLTWSSDSRLSRDEQGFPLNEKTTQVLSTPKTKSSANLFSFASPPSVAAAPATVTITQEQAPPVQNNYDRRQSELQFPPDFMLDGTNQNSLDRLVAWMLEPDPKSRPIVDRILESVGLVWVAKRRRAGATVYEGNWGPTDESLARNRITMPNRWR